MKKDNKKSGDEIGETTQVGTVNHNGDFDYMCPFGDDNSYKWTHKLKHFNEYLWEKQLLNPRLKTELAELAFQSAIYSANLAFNFNDESKNFTFVTSEEDSMTREKVYCEKHLALMASIATTSIPATYDERILLLEHLNECAKFYFRKDVALPEIKIEFKSRAVGNLATKRNIEEIEERHMYELRDGRRLPFGYMYREWLKLKKFIREADEVWDYSTGESSWQNLAGESGVALVRNEVVIGDLMLCIS